MSIRTDIYGYLTAQETIVGLLGANSLGKPCIFPMALDEGAPRPALTFQRMPSGHDQNLKGETGRSLGTFRITSWGNLYEDADALAEAVRRTFDGFRGQMGGTRVDAIELTNDFDQFFRPQAGQASGIYAIIFDFDISYAETISTPSN